MEGVEAAAGGTARKKGERTITDGEATLDRGVEEFSVKLQEISTPLQLTVISY